MTNIMYQIEAEHNISLDDIFDDQALTMIALVLPAGLSL